MAKKKEEVKEEKEVVVDTNSIKEEVMEYVDTQLDERFEKVFEDRFRKEFVQELDKANKKLIREKNRKILVKNIFLILFFGIILLLLYLLYTEHYFDQYFGGEKSTNKGNVVEKSDSKTEEAEEKVPTLEELKEEYASWIDPYYLNSDSSYVEFFYNGELTDEEKNYFALNTLSFEDLEVEDDYNTFDSKVLEDACLKLFSKCSNKSFDYNGNKVRYFQKLDSYITNSVLTKSDGNVLREIYDIQVEGDTIKISTVEGVVLDGGLYSLSPREFVRDYQEESILEDMDSLNKVVYHFEKKKLVSVEKG